MSRMFLLLSTKDEIISSWIRKNGKITQRLDERISITYNKWGNLKFCEVYFHNTSTTIDLMELYFNSHNSVNVQYIQSTDVCIILHTDDKVVVITIAGGIVNEYHHFYHGKDHIIIFVDDGKKYIVFLHCIMNCTTAYFTRIYVMNLYKDNPEYNALKIEVLSPKSKLTLCTMHIICNEILSSEDVPIPRDFLDQYDIGNAGLIMTSKTTTYYFTPRNVLYSTPDGQDTFHNIVDINGRLKDIMILL